MPIQHILFSASASVPHPTDPLTHVSLIRGRLALLVLQPLRLGSIRRAVRVPERTDRATALRRPHRLSRSGG